MSACHCETCELHRAYAKRCRRQADTFPWVALIVGLVLLVAAALVNAAPNPTFTQCPGGQWQHGNRNNGTAICDPLPTTTTVTPTTASPTTTTSSSAPTGTTLPAGTAQPFTIPNQAHVGRTIMSQPIIDVFGGDNSVGGLRGKPIYEEQNPDGTRALATGRFWWTLNLAPTTADEGIVQVSPNGYAYGIVARGTDLLQPAKEAPTVVAVPGTGFPAGWLLGFGAGYRVESSGGRTVLQVLACAACPLTSSCHFQATFPHGTCDGVPNGSLCSISSDCPTGHCEYVRNYLDSSPTDAVLYVGGCAANLDPRSQDWPESYAEWKYPGDMIVVSELSERQAVAPLVGETGYVTFATQDPVINIAGPVHPGDSVYVGEPVYPPTPLPGNPWYEVVTVHARPDGGGGTTVRGTTVVMPSVLPAFRDDFGDSCACVATNDCVCIRKRGFSHAGLITASHICVTNDGRGSHVVPCN